MIRIASDWKKNGGKGFEMKRLTCEMCGGTDLVKQDGLFVCQNCGTRYSLEEAKKMMIDGIVDVSGSTVKLDTRAELQNLYQLARRTKADRNNSSAQKYYEQILLQESSSWEAYFYSILLAAYCNGAGDDAAGQVLNCEESVFCLIRDYVKVPEEQRKAVEEVVRELKKFSERIDATAPSYDRCLTELNIVRAAGDWIVEIFGSVYGDLAVDCWKSFVSLHSGLKRYPFRGFDVKLVQKITLDWALEYIEKIRKYDGSYEPDNYFIRYAFDSSSDSSYTGACYVATAVYGSYDCPQVWTLRRYRDNVLGMSPYGRMFIRVYYAVSPVLVKWFGHTAWFRSMWRKKLDRMTEKLRARGIEDTPYEDKIW